MRTLLIAGAGLVLAGSGAADAQRMAQPGASYGMPGRAPMMAPHPVMQPHPTMPARPVGYPGGAGGGMHSRWGSKVNGHWWGGVNAPGGWGGYRRPHRGWAVPGYWNSPRFYIADWSTYGLAQPPYGYNWARYYDDAVLIDGRGSVYDTVGGLNWDRYDSTYYSGAYDDAGYDDGYRGDDTVYAPPPPPQGGYPAAPSQSGYPAPTPGYAPAPAYRDGGYARGYDHRSSGVGGAIAGAAVGGVAGNLIAGRGNRLGGTLIGAGVGGLAGYAIDRGSSRGHREPPVAPEPGYAGGGGA